MSRQVLLLSICSRTTEALRNDGSALLVCSWSVFVGIPIVFEGQIPEAEPEPSSCLGHAPAPRNIFGVLDAEICNFARFRYVSAVQSPPPPPTQAL